MSHVEEIIAGKVPLRVVGTWDDTHSQWRPAAVAESAAEEWRLARRTVARARLNLWAPRSREDRAYWPRRAFEPLTEAEFHNILGMLGPMPRPGPEPVKPKEETDEGPVLS